MKNFPLLKSALFVSLILIMPLLIILINLEVFSLWQINIFLTSIFGFITACLGYLAYSFNRERLRLDLFEKRWDQYLPMLKFCSGVSKYGRIPSSTDLRDETERQEIIDLLISAHESFRGQGLHKSKALFGKDIVSLCDELSKIYSFYIAHKNLNGDIKLIEEDQAHLKRLFEIVKLMPDYFRPYIYFGDYKC